ncbi:unnamed protein product [Paramecium pentaurelia]|uniref:WD40-repeat-containing domain n=1 Tax=Paramecium pentaurelia TaxID=43138 RepID=A0A8S1VFG5_9CILI|nr:unnamed protein product [Paramecium pentaurelia]
MLQKEYRFKHILEKRNKEKVYSRYRKIETEAKICDLAFNDQKLITAHDMDLAIYHLDQQNHLQKELIENLHTYLIYAVCFSKCGQWFLTAGYEKIIKLWQKEDNQWKCIQVLNGHKDSVIVLQMTSDEKQLFSRSRDKTIKIWQKQDEIWKCTQSIQATSGIVDSLCISPQENIFSFGCKNNLLIWYNSYQNKWKKYQAIVSAHTQLIESVCFIQNGLQIASGANDIKLWKKSIENQQYRLTQIITPLGNVSLMEYNDYNSLLIVVANKKFVQIWKVDDNANIINQQTIQVEKSDIFQEEDQFYEAICVSQNGQYLALTDNYNDYVDLWKLN